MVQRSPGANANGKFATLELNVSGSVAWLYLNRPGAMNAINSAMVAELREALAIVSGDSSIRVLVLSGKGKAFCAGGDLVSLQEGMAPATDGSLDYLSASQSNYNTLRHLPIPVVAAVNGLALAGGLELLLACDVIFAAESARIGDAHANFGVFPGAGGAAVLPERVGLNRAKYLMFSGDNFPARDFVACGLVQEVVPDHELEDSVSAFATKVAAKSPASLRRMKEVANGTVGRTTEEALLHEADLVRQHMRSFDMNEGLAAFREKRKPSFKGY